MSTLSWGDPPPQKKQAPKAEFENINRLVFHLADKVRSEHPAGNKLKLVVSRNYGPPHPGFMIQGVYVDSRQVIGETLFIRYEPGKGLDEDALVEGVTTWLNLLLLT